jgi:hypothetical protein
MALPSLPVTCVVPEWADLRIACANASLRDLGIGFWEGFGFLMGL